MREVFSEQLDDVYDDLAAMADDVRAAIRRATRALLEGDAFTAEEVISGDARIDRDREKIEDRCFRLLSLQQPVAGDLRTLVAALRIVSDLERMGDLAQHIAKVARLRVPGRAVPDDVSPLIRRMATVAEDMVARTAVTIVERDASGLPELSEPEQEMDALRAELFKNLLNETWTHGVEAAVDLALLGRYYERLGDHSCSVAKRVAYVVTGQRLDVD